MAPTVLDKYRAERQSKKNMFNMIQRKLKSHDSKPMDVVEINHYILEATRVWDEVGKIQANILTCSLSTDETIQEEEHIQEMFDLFVEVKCGLQRLQSTLSPSPVTAPQQVTVFPNLPERESSSIRLPKIILPTFSGDVNEWISFRDIYSTTIHKNKKLSPAEKFTYLQSSLTGSASKLIKSFQITDANYPIAWDIVVNRYQNERELYFSIIRKFMNKASATADNPNSLRSLVDSTKECQRALDTLTISDRWDALLLYVISQKLDPTSRQFWELNLKDTSIPTCESLLEFIEQRARSLHAGGAAKPKAATGSDNQRPPHAFHAQTQESYKLVCKFCNASHPNHKCPTFGLLEPTDRSLAVKKAKLCFNCLRSGHSSNTCSSDGRCHTCQRKHHTLLHQASNASNQGSDIQANHIRIPVKNQNKSKSQSIHRTEFKGNVKAHQQIHFNQIKETILATSLIQAKSKSKKWISLRAFADGGAGASFITLQGLNRLGLPTRRVHADITGFGNVPAGNSSSVCDVTFKSRFRNSNEEFKVQMHVVEKLTGQIPSTPQDTSKWTHLRNIKLADPEFNVPGDIDVLLGADVFFFILKNGIKKLSPEHPVAINSKLGWMISGANPSSINKIKVNHVDLNLESTLQQFWQTESIPKIKLQTKEEQTCEEHYKATVSRNPCGRYVVQIPFRNPPTALGSSRDMAVRRFMTIERRLKSKPKVQDAYREFMLQYESLGHMKQMTPEEESHISRCNFLPHHFVVKDEETMSKFRVVFDGSAKTSSGSSFNDTQLVGPTIQDTLYNIILRFRTHPVAFTADINKMYRQVLIDPTQHHYQCIVWRPTSSMPIKHYKLQTVTYGTASAPFLATRTIQQLAQDEEASLPLASAAAMRDFYVDDFLGGGSCEEEVKELIRQLRELCRRGGMDLVKFSSNCSNALRDVPSEIKKSNQITSMESSKDLVKTLGLYWDTESDSFQFKVRTIPKTQITKRLLLSQISNLFDPMGWLAPVIIRTKIIMQDVWKTNTDWDQPPPQQVISDWELLRDRLNVIETLRIPRCVQPRSTVSVELHGFSDASEKAYAAVVFIRCQMNNGGYTCNLITAKTKVAPVKTVSLPRLELCAAHLLTELMETVREAIPIQFSNIQAWTDSTIVLDWLSSSPTRWKTFVANRVSLIQETLPRNRWSHVKSEENPADCASRGIDPSELVSHHLWWHGPGWLQAATIPSQEPPQVPSSHLNSISKEQKNIITVSRAVPEITLLQRFSSLWKLTRVTAYCLRFVRNSSFKYQMKKDPMVPSLPINTGPLLVSELNSSLNLWIKRVQNAEFHDEIHHLSLQKPIPSRSKILPLSPFLDTNGLLRVGGRLRRALISPDQRTPVLLPRHHHLTHLIIQDAHSQTLHGGPQAVQAFLSHKFWIIRVRDAVRHQLKKCVKCCRHRGQTQTQIMADLPKARVNPARPFTTTGVDYAGPFLLRAIPVRSKATYKGYLALFICFATRAIHLEIVSSLSTESFLAALKRFISRRGYPKDIHSDCGTNFIGAANEMKEFMKLISSQDLNNQVNDYLSSKGICWHFNPAAAPHFGGLWEAGVKSVKHHLHRVIGSTRLTFEELTTVVSQIEACLNSRPLTPATSDPTDLSALTPAHFLIGDVIHSVPEDDYTNRPVNRLTRWQLVQQLQQHFWKRWSQEYLTRLQQRPKWLRPQREIQPGDMVLLKSDVLSPTNWPIARVVKIHPGDDGHTRAVTIRTKNGEFERPITKLCLLPIDNNISSSNDQSDLTV